jgi:hypothetical protein
MDSINQPSLTSVVVNGFPIQLSEPQEEEDEQENTSSDQRKTRIGLKYKPRETCVKCGKKHGLQGKKAESCRIAQGEVPAEDEGLCKHCGKKHSKDGNGKKAIQCRQSLLLRDMSFSRPSQEEKPNIPLYRSEETVGIGQSSISTSTSSSSSSSSSSLIHKRRRTDEYHDNLAAILSDIAKAHRSVSAIDVYGGEHGIPLKAEVLTILERVKARVTLMIDPHSE